MKRERRGCGSPPLPAEPESVKASSFAPTGSCDRRRVADTFADVSTALAIPAGPPVVIVDRAAIVENLRRIRQAVGPQVRICPAVKADAYGHGIEAVLPALRAERIDIVAVATLEEGIELRRRGWASDVLVFGRPAWGASPREAQESACLAVRHDLICTVGTPAEAAELSRAAARLDRPARVHVKVDTGMSRAGISAASLPGLVESIGRCGKAIRLEGLYTHFATADEPDLGFARAQLASFGEALAAVRPLAARQSAGTQPLAGTWAGILRHAANTSAIFCLPASHFDMVRPGLGVYGYWPDPHARPPVAMRPSMRVVGRIVAIKRVARGCAVGYGRTFVTDRDSTLGLVPIGYGDGYNRLLSNRAVMTVRAHTAHRQQVPVVGRISMDQTVIDLTDVPEPREGEAVVIIDNDPAAPNSVEAIARTLDTIPYEITCRLGRRLRRIGIWESSAAGVSETVDAGGCQPARGED